MTRVVLDTNVLVAAALTPTGLSSDVVALVVEERVRLCISQGVLAEYLDVLNREEIGIDPVHAKVLLKQVLSVCEWLTPIKKVTVSPDVDDNVFLECAEAGKAHYLITGNLRHFPDRWKYTKVVTARQFLAFFKSSPQRIRR